MTVVGQSETPALALGVAASTPKPDIRPEERGLTLQLGLQKGSTLRENLGLKRPPNRFFEDATVRKAG